MPGPCLCGDKQHLSRFIRITDDTKLSEMLSIFHDAMRYRFLRDYADPDEGHPCAAIHKQNDLGRWKDDYKSGPELDSIIDSYILDPSE